MIRIEILNCTFIVKGGTRLYERNPVLLYIRRFFPFIPLELKLFHMYIVLILFEGARCVYGAEQCNRPNPHHWE